MQYLNKSEYTFKNLFYLSPSVVNKRGVFGLLDHIRRDLKEVGLRGNVALSAQNKVTLIGLMTASDYPHIARCDSSYASSCGHPTPASPHRGGE